MSKSAVFIMSILISFNSFAFQVEGMDKLIARHQEKAQRPKSCPLESKKYTDILTKLESIKSVFKNNCTDAGATKLNEVVDSFKDIETELQKREIIDQTLESRIAENSNIKFSALFSNINNMIKKKQCNLEDGRVLETTANLIYDATQFGLISGSDLGVMIAGGGFVVSSAMKLIDLILKQRFDFEKNQDRQTFIKLNCSFYDIRATLESEGVLEVENTQSREDLKMVNEFIVDINAEIKRLNDEKQKMNETFSNLDERKLQEIAGNLAPIKKSLNQLKDDLNGIKYDLMNLPAETKKMLSITDIAKNYESLMGQMTIYKSLNVSTIPMLDDVFITELGKFNTLASNGLSETLKMPLKDFNEVVRPNFLYHIVRILSDIESQEKKAGELNSKVKKDMAKFNDAQREILTKKLNQLTVIKNKLDKIVSPKSFSALDDGTENTVSIIEDYKTISNLIYGEWGDKFLKFATDKSALELDNFKDRLARFNQKYGDGLSLLVEEKKPMTYFCQDAQRVRVGFKYADSVVQEGYDFIVTNKDLFYSDAKNHYNQSLNENNSVGLLGSIEKIQRHYISTILAVKKMKGEQIDPEEEDLYLKKKFMNGQYLGKSMLDIESARKTIKLIQSKYETINCAKIMKEDF